MSERVLPTEPGFWWYRWKKIGPVVGYVDWFGQLCLYDRKNQTPVSDCEFEWLEPVAPLGTAARLAAAEADVSHARHVIHGTGQLGASLREEAEIVAAALAQTRKMLADAEAELATLKQRIANTGDGKK